MSARWLQWLVVGLAAAALVAAVYLPLLGHKVKQSARVQTQSEEQARRELLQPAMGTSGEPRVKVTFFWASAEQDGTLAPITVELPLSSDPVLRAKEVLNTLLAGPVDAELRTLPPDAALLEFYLLRDGTGIADFSEPLATSLPSGIASEEMAVESITRTLEANVPQVQRLKILIHGQEVDTLAGHVDLTNTFVVNTKGPATSAPAASSGKLTPAPAPGKLSQPEGNP